MKFRFSALVVFTFLASVSLAVLPARLDLLGAPAPTGLLDRSVTAYIAPNPMRGG